MNPLYSSIISNTPRDLKFFSEEAIAEVYHQILVEIKSIAERQYKQGGKEGKRDANRLLKLVNSYLSKPLPVDRIKLLEHYYNTILQLEASGTLMGFEYHEYEKTENHSFRVTGPSLLNPEKDSIYLYNKVA